MTWDEHSLFVRGERIFLYSAEFHPWRLPVPDLWVDVLQKIKALGYNGVSFYVDWALLEGSPGHFSAEGALGYEAFFSAAEELACISSLGRDPTVRHHLPNFLPRSITTDYISKCRGFRWRVSGLALPDIRYSED